MSQPASGRILCPACGANNFTTQAACWKCGASLSGAPRPTSASVAPPPSVAPSLAASPDRAPIAYQSARTIDPAVAVWSAVALALFFPYVAVPIGIIFLMLDDRRRAEIGRITLIWGIIATVAQSVLLGMLVGPTISAGMKLFGGISGRATGMSEPKLTDPVPSNFPRL